MANLNKVMLIGRLTRDPEVRTFTNGGKVANFGFAVNNRKKNTQTGEWEDEPVWLDCKAFNRGDYGKLADRVEQYLTKGKQVYLEGHLQLEQWDDKATGQKRTALRIVVDEIQFLDAPKDGQGVGGGGSRTTATGTANGRQSRPQQQRRAAEPPEGSGYGQSNAEEDIPF